MSTPGERDVSPKLRVVVVEDDPFVASLVSEGLRAHDFSVASVHTSLEAWELVSRDPPHAVVSDLNLGPNDSAAPVLRRIREEFPWVGLVVLTSHLSPELAIPDADSLPEGVVYQVKTQLRRVGDLSDAVTRSIAGRPGSTRAPEAEAVVITPRQAEVLRMLADGASTSAIAEHRKTTVRAVEAMIARLYTALGVASDEQSNPRVAATRLWLQGRVIVSDSGTPKS